MENSVEIVSGYTTGSPSYEAFDSTFPGSSAAAAASSSFHHNLENIEASDMMFYVFIYKIGVPVLFCLIMFIGLIGNSLVVAVTVTQRKMQSTVNLLLLNLAFSDLTFLVLCIPFMTYHYVAENWLIGDAACKVMQFIVHVTVYVTVYTLVCISVLRFQHIVCSRGPSQQPPLRIAALVLVIWTVMLTANSPILIIYRVKKYGSDDRPGEPYYYCGMDDPELHGRRLFLSFFVLAYLLPLTTISTMYLLILRYLNARKACLQLTNQTMSDSASKRTSHASRISTAIIVVFALCWLPLHVNLLVVNYGTQPQTWFYQVARVLCHVAAYANSCINPLVYHYVSADFRQSLRSFCVCRWCRKRLRRGKTDFWPRDIVLKEWTHRADTGNIN